MKQRRTYVVLTGIFTLATLGFSIASCGGGVGGTPPPPPPQGKDLYVSNSGAVAVFDTLSTGMTSPLLKFGDKTGLLVPGSVAVDPVNDEIYVGDCYHKITVLQRTASGEAAPIRTLTVTPPLSPATSSISWIASTF